GGREEGGGDDGAGRLPHPPGDGRVRGLPVARHAPARVLSRARTHDAPSHRTCDDRRLTNDRRLTYDRRPATNDERRPTTNDDGRRRQGCRGGRGGGRSRTGRSGRWWCGSSTATGNGATSRAGSSS